MRDFNRDIGHDFLRQHFLTHQGVVDTANEGVGLVIPVRGTSRLWDIINYQPIEYAGSIPFQLTVQRQKATLEPWRAFLGDRAASLHEMVGLAVACLLDRPEAPLTQEVNTFVIDRLIPQIEAVRQSHLALTGHPLELSVL